MGYEAPLSKNPCLEPPALPVGYVHEFRQFPSEDRVRDISPFNRVGYDSVAQGRRIPGIATFQSPPRGLPRGLDGRNFLCQAGYGTNPLNTSICLRKWGSA